jgi:SagB-type dehydrogenase family enzyme
MRHHRQPSPRAAIAPNLVPLSRPAMEGPPLARVLAARRSCREFAGRELTEVETSSLLWAGQGITSPEGFRAAPSAGALYPTTLTLVDHRGLWRYLPDRHALEKVREGDRRPRLAAAALGQEAVAEAPATIVVTAEPSVLAERYRSRAERYCLLEAGHVVQNVLLQAAALGLAGVPVGAFDDGDVLEVVELGRDHLALYLVPVGAPRAALP